MKLAVYGSTGYVGELIVKEAHRRGIEVIALGRDHTKLKAIYQPLGVPYQAFSLEADEQLDATLSKCTVLLNTAGPFEKSAMPLAKACIRNKVHYLDIAGEIYSFDQIKSLSEMARQQQVMLMPGVGYGVVPSDIIAETLIMKVKDHKELIIGLYTDGGVSTGTLHTILSNVNNAGVKIVNGTPASSYPGEKNLQMNFGTAGIKTVTNNPWRADLSVLTERHHIQNLTTYMAYPALLRIIMSSRLGRRILGSDWLMNFLKKSVLAASKGPDATTRKQGASYVYGKIVNAKGTVEEMVLRGPEAYDFTVLTALKIVEFIFEGKQSAGFVSPAQVYGIDWIYEIDGVTVESII